MALARVLSCAVVGLDGSLVEVEVDVSRSALPSITIVGLPDAAVNESKERVRSAIEFGGPILKPPRVTINLAPADLRKKVPRTTCLLPSASLLATDQIHAT